MAGCFAESRDVYEFADNLYNKRDMVTVDDRRGPRTSADIPKRLGKIPTIDKFDAGYFGVCHEEADQMDPKLRIMLEKSYEAIVDSGYDVRELAGKRVAVLVANADTDTEDRALLFPTRRPNFAVTGCCRSMVAQRISYHFQFAGPSYNFDTACSSSLHALEHAYRALSEDRCEHAIIVGGQLCLNDITTLNFVRLSMVGPTGACKVFDERADGYVRSEAFAAIHVQKARDARRIYAQVVHIKTNCDGYKEQGLISPSTEMQQKLFEDLYRECKITPSSIDFLEAHGTGTPVGDELEALAVDAVFCKDQKKPLLIGSTKSVAGHTEPVSFLTSLVKVLVAMERGHFSPNIHFETPRICIEALAEGRFKVPVQVTPWPENGSGLVAINNFGFGGSNAHILLRRFQKRKSEGDGLPRLVCVSGRTEEAVGEVLHDIGRRELDEEFCGLVQQALRDSHDHRGFIIHSTLGEIQRAMGVRPKIGYCLFFPDAPAEIVEIGRKLSALKAFVDSMRRIDASLLEKLEELARASLTIQLSFVDLLRKVNLPISFAMGKGPAVAYVNGKEDLSFRHAHDLIVISFGSEETRTFAHQVNISTDDPVVSLLKLLGDAYLMGYAVHPENLYPPMSWPVGRGTPMISPLIKWDHATDWYTILQTPRPIWSKVSVQIKDTVWSCLPDYKIDGSPTFPMTGYLYMIWERFAKMMRIPLETSCVSFQKVKFHNVTQSSKTFSDCYVEISKVTQKFEVYDSGTLRVTGSVSSVENWRGETPDFEPGNANDPLYSEDIYKELSLRGYNYSGAFCGLTASDISDGVTKLKWGSNWVTFFEGLLQARLLQEDTRELHLPVAIDDLTVDASKFESFPAGADHAVLQSRSTGIVGSRCVELRGLSTMAVPRRNNPKPVMETYAFVPLRVELPTEVAVRVFMQIYLEDSHTLHIKIVEVDEGGDLGRFFEKALDHHTLVTGTISKAKNLANLSQCGIIVVREASKDHALLRAAFDSLRPGGVVITREKADFSTTTLPGVAIVSVAKTGPETLVLLRKIHHVSESKIITVTNKLDWLAEVQKAVKTGEEALLLVDNEPLCGILGLIKCLRCEPGGAQLRCIFIMDQGVRFSLGDSFFAEQLELGLAINVLKNGVWGTYRHLLLGQGEKKVVQHVFGELSTGKDRSFEWIQGPLTVQDAVEPNMAMVQVHCVSVELDTWGTSSTDRLSQSKALSLGFSGRDLKGRRVMGMAPNGSLSTLVLADRRALWEIPQEWTFEEAASVPVTYGTALYGIVHLAKVTCGERILIHSGASEIGQAAIRVARSYKCDIYTTADSWRQSELIRVTFPEIPDSHISGWRDGSFEEMVLKQTKGRGVDIVVNSWSTDREASLRCLGRKGRFIENGRCEGAQMSFLRHGRAISAPPNLFSTPCLDVVGRLLKNALVQGLVKPSRAKTCTPDEVHELYRNVASGRSVVKIGQTPLNASPRFWCDSQMTYVVIGGLGGVGLELVDWLVLRGGRKFVLVSRRGVVKGYASLRVKLWRSYGAVVRVSTDDVASREGCEALLRHATPVAGIFNLASVVTDHTFETQTEEGFTTALTPKAYTTSTLDAVSRQLCPSLRHFVVFSTIACGRGNIGQEAYAMANSIAERICEARRKDGLPGLAIQWGPIIEVGTEVGNQSRAELLLGVLQQAMSSCLSCLDTFLLQPEPVVSSTVISKKRKGAEETANLVTAVRDALGITNLKTVSENASLSELGMDSISFVEIKQMLEKELDLFLTPREVREFTFAQLKKLVPEANST